MANSHSPFHPIIYVRGYAMTPGRSTRPAPTRSAVSTSVLPSTAR